MLDYTDDHTAIRYLSTCRSLRSGYHHYPLKRAMSEYTFRYRTNARIYLQRPWKMGDNVMGSLSCHSYVWLVLFNSRWPDYLVLGLLYSTIIILIACYSAWLLRQRECCESGRLTTWRRRWYPVPRVTRLRTELYDAPLLPYLQHLTELTIRHDMKDKPIGAKYPLPHSLRTLRLVNSPDLVLEPHTLPPRLTSLSLGSIKNDSLPIGVLPESLTSLELIHGFDTRWAVEESVLPSSLLRLKLYEWTLPLSDLALPASLTELDIASLSNYPLPALPPQLELLAIGGGYDQPLTGKLPASLRILRLSGYFGQPLTADLFDSTPQLKELCLSDYGTTRQLDVSVLPRSLRVLRVGEQYELVMAHTAHIPPHMERVIVPAEWDTDWLAALQHIGQTYGFTVEQEAGPAREEA